MLFSLATRLQTLAIWIAIFQQNKKKLAEISEARSREEAIRQNKCLEIPPGSQQVFDAPIADSC